MIYCHNNLVSTTKLEIHPVHSWSKTKSIQNDETEDVHHGWFLEMRPWKILQPPVWTEALMAVRSQMTGALSSDWLDKSLDILELWNAVVYELAA